MQTARWTVHEVDLTGTRGCVNPVAECTLVGIFTSPTGAEKRIEGFWDGDADWKLRFCPDELGTWTWRTECSDAGNAGLHGQTGRFECIPYDGDNPLFRHGPITLSEDRRRFVHADGTPFFWLADTAWNGALRSRPEDWERYLSTRQAQRFTAIQFVSTQWRGCSKDPFGQVAFVEEDPVRINPALFRRLDARVDAVVQHGLVPAPVVLWALLESDPGRKLSVENCIRVAKYIVARWGAHPVIWLLGGDGHYYGEHADRWRAIGRAVFGERHDRLVTLHPCGLSWVAEEYRDEEWFDFIGYQSGHGDGEKDIRWLTEGPPATGWQSEPARPVVNLEPNYEGHPAYQSKRPHGSHAVRRAAYWSLLDAYPAGVTYGTNAIWVWPEEVEDAEGHAGLANIPPWHEGLLLPGIRNMTTLRVLFDHIPWTRLTPDPSLVRANPGLADPERHIAAARTPDGDCAVAYVPVGGQVSMDLSKLKLPAEARWFDPQTGWWQGETRVEAARVELTTPDDRDWVLVIGGSPMVR